MSFHDFFSCVTTFFRTNFSFGKKIVNLFPQINFFDYIESFHRETKDTVDFFCNFNHEQDQTETNTEIFNTSRRAAQAFRVLERICLGADFSPFFHFCPLLHAELSHLFRKKTLCVSITNWCLHEVLLFSSIMIC